MQSSYADYLASAAVERRKETMPDHRPFHHGVRHRSIAAASGCGGFEEQRPCFRAAARLGERLALGKRRQRFRDPWVSSLAELAAT